MMIDEKALEGFPDNIVADYNSITDTYYLSYMDSEQFAACKQAIANTCKDDHIRDKTKMVSVEEIMGELNQCCLHFDGCGGIAHAANRIHNLIYKPSEEV